MMSQSSRLEHVLYALLIACTAAALAGYATFGLHPGLAGSNAGLSRAYALAITGFPRVHIAVGFLAISATLTRAAPRRWIGGALALYVVSLGSELLGTSIGRPFGPYRYTEALGAKWFGLVPLLIPLSWLTMTLASFTLARRALGVRHRLTTVGAGAALLIAWDLALDPAMSRLTPYWVWGTTGPYFGMPWLNLVGWFVTGALLHAILLALRTDGWVDALSPAAVRAILIVYAANLALPVGMTVAAGLPLAAAASAIVIGLTILLSRPRRASRGRSIRSAPRTEVVR